ncbi:hypothetical protein ACLOJK_037077 [Asimina triloba]
MELVSVLQLKDGLRKGNMTFLVTLIEERQMVGMEMPSLVIGERIDHNVKRMPVAQPLVKALYCMTLTELREFRD